MHLLLKVFIANFTTRIILIIKSFNPISDEVCKHTHHQRVPL
jgi:hypothetical protein